MISTDSWVLKHFKTAIIYQSSIFKQLKFHMFSE